MTNGATAAPITYDFIGPTSGANVDLGQSHTYTAAGGPSITGEAGTYSGSSPANNSAFNTASGVHLASNNPGNDEQGELAQHRASLWRPLYAVAVQPEKPDLILTGLQSDDLGYGQTGPILAELLGLPHATIIMEVEKQDGGIRVKRELEDGWFQHVEMLLPALLTIQSGINKLRYATLMGIKKAKTKEVKRLTTAELGGVRQAAIRFARVYLPEKTKHSQIFDGAPKEAAAKLVEKLKFEARVL